MDDGWSGINNIRIVQCSMQEKRGGSGMMIIWMMIMMIHALDTST